MPAENTDRSVAAPAGSGGQAPVPTVPVVVAPAAVPVAPVAAAPVPAPAATPEEPSWLAERLERERRTVLRKTFGSSNEDDIKAKLARADELEKKAEADRLAQLSETQRKDELLAQATVAAKQAEQAADVYRNEARVLRLAARNKIADPDYLEFRIGHARRGLEAGQTLDEEKFVATLLADPLERVKLGIDAPAVAAPTTTTERAATTTVVGAEPLPKGTNGQAQTAYDLPPAEWAKRKAVYGLG